MWRRLVGYRVEKKPHEINISSTKKTLSNACNCNLLKSKEEIAVRTVKIV